MTAAASRTIEIDSEEAMFELGSRVARALPPGSLVSLTGSLGAGKTVFVRGMAAGLGIDPAQVRSPSFTLLNEYALSEATGSARAVRRLIHLDLYRLDDPGEVEELGLVDYLSPDSIVAVEWGEKLPPRLLAGAARVTVEDGGADRRRVTLTPDYSSPCQ